MGRLTRIGDLQLQLDPEFQRREWRFRRVGWIAMALLLVLSILGLFGSGVLSDTSARTAGLEIRYPRFTRWRAPDDFEVVLTDLRAAGAEFWIAAEYLDGMDIDHVAPEPLRWVARDGRIHYEFAASGPDLRIRFHCTPTRPGCKRLRIGVAGGELQLWQFTYP